jgi:hypothetical protein
MSKSSTNVFDSSQDVIIPVGLGDTTRRKFPTLLSAISQIQQFFVIEKTGQEIPDEFLTLQGKMNFFNTGFGSGFVEGLTFALLASLTLPVLSDPSLMMTVARYFPLAGSKLFLRILSCFPILLTGALCCYLSRFRIGILTRKSIDAFLFGRLVSLMVKGGLIFAGLTALSGVITQQSAWSAAKWVSFKHDALAHEIYRILLNTKPHLIDMAYETVAIFTIAVVLPFITIWGVSFIRKIKAKKDEASWDRLK